MHLDRASNATIDFYGLAIDALDNGDQELLIANIESRPDAAETRMARRLFRSGDTILVAGAGYGGTAASVALVIHPGQVICYEPDPERARMITEHIRVRNSVLHTVAAALGNEDGHADYFRSGTWPASGLSKAWAGEDADRPITVPVHHAGTVATAYQITGLVLDVEGAEHAILPVLPWPQLRAIVVEIHGYDEATIMADRHVIERGGLTIVETEPFPHGQVIAAERQPKKP